jgi:hypothetical protein
MTHIDAGATASSAIGLMPPDGEATLRELAERLLEAPTTLAPGERELIIGVVSGSTEPTETCVSAKLRALVQIARKARIDAKTLTTEDADAARAAGATDREVQDAVLIGTAVWLVS